MKRFAEFVAEATAEKPKWVPPVPVPANEVSKDKKLSAVAKQVVALLKKHNKGRGRAWVEKKSDGRYVFELAIGWDGVNNDELVQALLNLGSDAIEMKPAADIHGGGVRYYIHNG